MLLKNYFPLVPPSLICHLPGRRTVIALFVLPDPENMGVAVGILLLFCVEVEKYVLVV